MRVVVLRKVTGGKLREMREGKVSKVRENEGDEKLVG